MNNPPEKISAITKALSLFVACGIIFGLILGKTSPAFGSSLAKFIPVGLFLMIFPQMVKVDLGKVKEAFRGGKQLLITPLYNYLCSPFLVFLLAYIFLPDEPYLRTGLILTGVAPCIPMVGNLRRQSIPFCHSLSNGLDFAGVFNPLLHCSISLGGTLRPKYYS